MRDKGRCRTQYYTDARETTHLIMVDEQSKAHQHVPLDILVPVICIYLLFHSYYLILTILVYTFFISVQNFWVIVRSWCLWDLLYIGGFNDQHYVGTDCVLLVVAPDCVIFIIMCHDGYFRLRFWTVTDGNRLFFWHDGVYGNLHYFVGKNI